MDPQTNNPTPIDDVLEDKSLLTGPSSLGGSSDSPVSYPSTSSPAQPSLPADPPQPVFPTDLSQPTLPTDPNQPALPTDPPQPVFPTDLSQPTLPADPSTISLPGAAPFTNVIQNTEESAGDVKELEVRDVVKKDSVPAIANMSDIKSLLAATYDQKASDLHLAVGYPPIIRVDGKLTSIGAQVLTKEQVKELIRSVLSNEQNELLEVNKEVDLAIDFEDKARFRVNAFTEKGVLSAAFRLIPSKIKTLDELNLPKKLHEFCSLEQGLILVTGPTGHGKSTTLAALLQEINQSQDRHIITIEDPIEYVFPKAQGLVQQRELHQDTHSWEVALRSVLREDPDVVMVGEMRDFETMAATITVAETGHLVFATLHTNSASQSIDRIIDVFPPHQQMQIRVQLANVLEGVISQRLLPKIGGGRIAAVELMVATPAVRNLIREQKSYQIDNIISTSYDLGMQTIERALAGLVTAGSVDIETAKRYSVRPDELDKLLNMNL